MTCEEWVSSVPTQFKDDALWRIEAYRLGLFIGDIGWHDVVKLRREPMMIELASQLFRALGSISANIAEGFSRSSGKEKARFYEYALGSARESRDWYYKARHSSGSTVTHHRLELLTQLIRLLITMIHQQRQKQLKEIQVEYQTGNTQQEIPF